MAADYTTLAVLKASLGITDTNDDTALGVAITAASRAIDQHTGAQFFTTTEARLYEPADGYSVWVDPFTTTSGLVVKTGTNGTYPTTINAADVTPWPYNAPSKDGAYCKLQVATGFLPAAMWGRPTVQVTATWGYGSVPSAVAEACRLKAARLFRRKNSPEGVAGSSEFGVVRISRFEDPDVAMLLAPYTRPLVG